MDASQGNTLAADWLIRRAPANDVIRELVGLLWKDERRSRSSIVLIQAISTRAPVHPPISFYFVLFYFLSNMSCYFTQQWIWTRVYFCYFLCNWEYKREHVPFPGILSHWNKNIINIYSFYQSTMHIHKIQFLFFLITPHFNKSSFCVHTPTHKKHMYNVHLCQSSDLYQTMNITQWAVDYVNS